MEQKFCSILCTKKSRKSYEKVSKNTTRKSDFSQTFSCLFSRGPQASGKTTIYADFCDNYATTERISTLRLNPHRSTLEADRKTLETLQGKIGMNAATSGKRTSGAWGGGRRLSSLGHIPRGFSPRNSSLKNDSKIRIKK